MATGTLAGNSALTRHVTNGVIGGLVGGVVFGIMMAMQGMIPMIAAMVGSQSDIVGWVIHLLISAFIGGTFGMIASRLPAGWPAAPIGGIRRAHRWHRLGRGLVGAGCAHHHAADPGHERDGAANRSNADQQPDRSHHFWCHHGRGLPTAGPARLSPV